MDEPMTDEQKKATAGPERAAKADAKTLDAGKLVTLELAPNPYAAEVCLDDDDASGATLTTVARLQVKATTYAAAQSTWLDAHPVGAYISIVKE
ncbi:MAG: hypothetical protein H7123_00445 [Thermoleophilia bacterium]|nr:hypothetical protein [Thermoleophilia bacterium]